MSLLCGATAFCEEGSETAATVKAEPISNLAPGGPTEEQIAEMKTEWTDDKRKSRLHFAAGFSKAAINEQEKKKYEKSGKIPIRITADFVEIKEVGGKEVSKRLGGSIKLCVKDSDGKVLIRKSVPVEKMCPS